MPRSPSEAIVIVGASDTLAGAEREIRLRGIRLRRIVALRCESVRRQVQERALAEFGRFDAIVFTSRQAVASFLPGRWNAHRRASLAQSEVIAIGRRTARALGQRRIPADWIPEESASEAILRRLSRGPSRRIVYPRSDRAGPRFARALRRQGHRVLDLVAYRVRPRRRLPVRDVRWLKSGSPVVVTSPSALANLRQALAPSHFARFRSARSLIVLGERSARAARGHGFGGVRVAPMESDASLARFLVSAL